MKALVVIPASDVRPGELRWWCEDGEHPDRLDRVAVMPRDLHTESAEDCGFTGMYALAIREVVLVGTLRPREPVQAFDLGGEGG